MRIVQLVEDLELGGLERLAADLRPGAASVRASACWSYCLYRAGALAASLEAAGIPVVAFQKGPGFSAGTVLAMAKRLRADRADVIHGHNPGVHHYAALAAKLAGVPVCINTRHSVIDSQGRPYQERYFRWVQPLNQPRACSCATSCGAGLQPSEVTRRRKCSVIVNGIPLEPFLAHQAAPGSRRPRIRFGTIGRLVPP